jgi:hypothetical protein
MSCAHLVGGVAPVLGVIEMNGGSGYLKGGDLGLDLFNSKVADEVCK